MQFMIIFALIVSIFAVMFALQNPTVVPMHFIIWDFEQPLTLYLLISIIAGAFIISILTIPSAIKNRQARNRHRKEVADLEDNLSKYRSNLIDAQNSNKDLRQKILEIEQAKEALEQAQAKAQEEISDLHAALNKADLSAAEADQARKEAVEARENINLALRELEIKLNSAEESAGTYKGLLEQMAPAMPYLQAGNGGEIDVLNEEAALDEPPTETEEPAAPAAEAPAEPETPAEPEQPQEEKQEPKKNRFSWF